MAAARRTKRTYNRQPKPAAAPVAEAAPIYGDEQLAQQQAAPASVPRPEMRAAERQETRPPMRTSLQEAADRAAQIFGTVDLDSEEDKFALPPGLAPEGWGYEWKTLEVYGKRDPGREVQMSRMGWDPVDTSRHPEMMPQNYQGQIVREGMGLFQRPEIVNQRQRQAAYQKARDQLRDQQQITGHAPNDTMQRHDSDGRPVGQTGGKVRSEFMSPGALKNEGFVAVSGIPE